MGGRACDHEGALLDSMSAEDRYPMMKRELHEVLAAAEAELSLWAEAQAECGADTSAGEALRLKGAISKFRDAVR